MGEAQCHWKCSLCAGMYNLQIMQLDQGTEEGWAAMNADGDLQKSPSIHGESELEGTVNWVQIQLLLNSSPEGWKGAVV